MMFKKNTGVWGRSPQKILTYFEVKNDFAIHEFTPENPVTFQKSILIHRLQDSWIPVVSPVVNFDYRNIIPVVKTNYNRNPNSRAETLYMF